MIDDDSGVDFLPAKLLVALVIAALLLVLMVSGIDELSGTFSADKARGDAVRIAEFARTAYCTDSPDSTSDRFITVSIPASVRLIAYGAVPASGTQLRMDQSYYLEYVDGRSETFVADMPFASDQPGSPADVPVLLYPGEYCIKARPVNVNGTIKAAISAEAL